jgi:hypothetical protein
MRLTFTFEMQKPSSLLYGVLVSSPVQKLRQFSVGICKSMGDVGIPVSGQNHEDASEARRSDLRQGHR